MQEINEVDSRITADDVELILHGHAVSDVDADVCGLQQQLSHHNCMLARLPPKVAILWLRFLKTCCLKMPLQYQTN